MDLKLDCYDYCDINGVKIELSQVPADVIDEYKEFKTLMRHPVPVIKAERRIRKWLRRKGTPYTRNLYVKKFCETLPRIEIYHRMYYFMQFY